MSLTFSTAGSPALLFHRIRISGKERTRMKKAFLLLIFFGLSSLSWAQDAPALYTAVSGSVVYLQHEIFLDSKDCSNPELWRKFEKLIKRPILDTAWPLMSGSGFFVDSDGAILTNRHVVQTGDLKQVRIAVIRSVQKSIDKDFASDFGSGERAVLKRDFDIMISKGRYSFSAMIGTQNLGAVTVLAEASDDEPDLAVVRAAGGPFHAIRLADSEAIGPDLVGTEVFSFGYPLGSELDVLFQERAVTMNRGSISAFRRTELSLQHSAAISHGNSGGPLVNGQGLVLGVNTAGLQEQEGNSLFYAIDAGKVNGFLAKRGFKNLLLWNRRLPGLASNLKLNALGEIECSADVILDIDKNVEVLLDDARMGSGPLLLHLVNPVSSLELRGPKGVFSSKLRLLAALSGSTTLKPSLARRDVSVVINSNPSGATVMADGKDLGRTPLSVSLTGDKYLLHLRQEDQWYADSTVEVLADRPNEFNFSGQRAYLITLNELPRDDGTTLRFESTLGAAIFRGDEKVSLPDGDWKLSVEGNDAFSGVTVSFQVRQQPVVLDLAFPVMLNDLAPDPAITLRFQSKSGKATFKGNDKIRLPTGDWSLSIDGEEAFTGVTVPFQVQQQPVTVDLSHFRKRASFRIVGFGPRARLWIDDQLFPNPTADTIQLPVGMHTVYAWENGITPLEKMNIKVHADNKSSVAWNRRLGHDVTSSILGWGGAGAGAAGLVLVGFGLYGSQNSVALSQTHSYQDYVSFRNMATIEFWTGGALLVGAVVSELIALDQKNKYETQRRYMSSLESK
jgi:S1-C subfamily serine protease